MPYPAAYLKDEKEFLARIAARVPHMRAHFDECTNIYPQDRPRALAKKAARTTPDVWEAMDIPAHDRRTYAELQGAMARLAFVHPHDDYDRGETLALVRVSLLPDLIAGDLYQNNLSAAEITRTRDLAMRLMLDGVECREYWNKWDAANDAAYPEAQLTRDLRRVALAAMARDYRKSYPALAGKLDTLVISLRAGLETEHGRAVMAKELSLPYAPRPVRTAYDLD